MAAKSEIQEGSSVALNWPMHNIAHPGFGRKPLEHKVFSLDPYKAHDDEIAINTQAGSQWDGFKHWGHQKSGMYYNNLKHEDVMNTNDNGIHHISERGGIVGRGVLLDYVRYAEQKGIKYDPWTRHEITVADLNAICEEQGVELKQGDVIIVRSGFVKKYEEATEDERIQGVQNGHNYIGIQGCEEMVEWLWDHHFSAIAGDTIAMEAWPPADPWSTLCFSWYLGSPANTFAVIHDFSLALWGEPIGELWNLEKLAEECANRKRWSFFFTSAPLNVVGGVGTPPNALAIF